MEDEIHEDAPLRAPSSPSPSLVLDAVLRLDMNESCRRIFISHASKDAHRIEGLVLLLRGLGYGAFVASDSIPLGTDWDARLRAELDACDMVIVAWTRAASESGWVRLECELASKNPARPIVPIDMDGTPFSGLLAERQGVRIPLVDTVLQTLRAGQERGLGRREIDRQVRALLLEQGIELSSADFGKIRVFASGTATGFGLLALGATTSGSWLWSSAATKVAVVVAVGAGASVGVGAMMPENSPQPAGVRSSRSARLEGPPLHQEAKTRPDAAVVAPAPIGSAESADAVEPVAPSPAALEGEPDSERESEETLPRVCSDGFVLDIRARHKPGEHAWDLAPGTLARPDMMGSIEIDGTKERLRLREDRSHISAPFFAGKPVPLDGKMKVHIFDRDLNFHDPMASAEVHLADVFAPGGTIVGYLGIEAHCR